MDKSYYNSISKGYEELHREEQEAKLRLIKAEIEALWGKPGKKVDGQKQVLKLLDVGCGTGVTSDFSEYDIEVTGVDPAKRLLDKADAKGLKRFRTVLAEAENLPFKDNKFDIVISVTAIQNFHDIEKGLKEIKRVGKDKFVLTFLKRSEKKDIILRIIKDLFEVEKEIEEDKDIILFCTAKTI